MAATCTLLELTPFKRNPYFSYHHLHGALLCYKPHSKSNYVCLQIACNYRQSTCVRSDSIRDKIWWKNSFEQIAIEIKKVLYSLKKPAIAAVLITLLLFHDPNCASARSGGRIGGRAFSSSSSTTYSEPRSSRSTPVRRESGSSYREWVRPRESEPSFCESVPSFRGTTTRLTSDPEFWFSSSLYLCAVGFIALSLVSVFRSWNDTRKISVLKLQVGLLGSGRTLQQDLNRLSETADTSTSKGLSYVLTEAILALLRHPEYCVSFYSSVNVKQSVEEGEKQFNQLSIEERGKFGEETLVNVGSIRRQSSKIERDKGVSNEYIVVTILVVAVGVHKLERINGNADLKEALQKIGSIPRNQIMAVELLWTPQDEKEAMSERELLEDYPLLRPL